jgi:hypothetical protein
LEGLHPYHLAFPAQREQGERMESWRDLQRRTRDNVHSGRFSSTLSFWCFLNLVNPLHEIESPALLAELSCVREAGGGAHTESG